MWGGSTATFYKRLGKHDKTGTKPWIANIIRNKSTLDAIEYDRNYEMDDSNPVETSVTHDCFVSNTAVKPHMVFCRVAACFLLCDYCDTKLTEVENTMSTTLEWYANGMLAHLNLSKKSNMSIDYLIEQISLSRPNMPLCLRHLSKMSVRLNIHLRGRIKCISTGHTHKCSFLKYLRNEKPSTSFIFLSSETI